MITVNKIYIFLYLSFAWLLPYSMQSQTPMAGVEFGYGRSQKTAYGHSFISPFDEDFYIHKHIGLQYSQPLFPLLSLSSGLEFTNKKRSGDFSYLAITLRVNLTFGNSFQFILGPGLNLNYLIDYDLGYFINHKSFEENRNRIQINWQLHAGAGFKINPKTRVYFLYELGFDLTPIYKNLRWYDGIISAGVMTNILKKESH